MIERLDISSLFVLPQNEGNKMDASASMSDGKEGQVENASKGNDAKHQVITEKVPTIHVKAKASNDTERAESHVSFYQLFLQEVKLVCFGDAKSIDEISECMKLHKLQVRNWLEQAQNEGVIKKLEKPVRYQWNGCSVEPKQQCLF